MTDPRASPPGEAVPAPLLPPLGHEGASPRSTSLQWFINPYVLILAGALLNSAGEVLLSKGSKDVAVHTTVVMGFASLRSGWTWLGIIAYVSSFVSWLYVLRLVPLSVAFPVSNVVHVFVPLGASLFLHESVPPRRWIGISAVILGICLIVRPLAKAEEKL